MAEAAAGKSSASPDSASVESAESPTDVPRPKCIVSIKKSLLPPSFRWDYPYSKQVDRVKEEEKEEMDCTNSPSEAEDSPSADGTLFCTSKELKKMKKKKRCHHYCNGTSGHRDSFDDDVVLRKRKKHRRRKSSRLFEKCNMHSCLPANWSSPGPSCCDIKIQNSPETSSTVSVLATRPHLRKIKRKRQCDESCPVCGVTVRSRELRSHYEKEIQRLDAIPQKLKKMKKKRSTSNKSYEQVRANREDRIKIPFKRGIIDMKCPACCESLNCCFENVLHHISDCLKQENTGFLFEDDFDADSDTNEEYTWGDDIRIRSTSLLNSINDIAGDVIQKTEENDIVEIMDPDDAPYGPSQYSERDIIPNFSTSEDTSRTALRNAVISAIEEATDQENSSVTAKMNKNKNHPCKKFDIEHGMEKSILGLSSTDSLTENGTPESLLIESLTRRIRELENSNSDEAVKCHVCFGSYQTPLVSTTCWHVHCNDCWMQLLGEKKLCPQCSTITLPCNLRRVYI